MKTFFQKTLTTLCVLAVALGCAESREAEGTGQQQDGHDEARHEEPGVVELSPEAAARAGIRTAAVEQRILESEMATTGQVDFDQTRLAHVSPRITGRVHDVRARLGQDVAAGELLAQVDSVELGRMKAEFLQAKARLELARKIFERERGLFEERISSEQEVLAAESAFREATTVMVTAEETLHLYGLDNDDVETLRYDDPQASVFSLVAPFAGTIIERHATLGELVTPERNLFTLADLDRVWIWIDIYQRDLGRVHPGDEVRARVDAYPGEVFSGTLSYLGAQVDTDTRTVRARLDVDNLDGKLRPGMFVDVELSDPHSADGGTMRAPSRVVPADAVQRDGDALVVFVALGPGRFERREIHGGRRAGGWIEVLDGVETGEMVAVDGVFVLKSAAATGDMGEGHAH